MEIEKEKKKKGGGGELREGRRYREMLEVEGRGGERDRGTKKQREAGKGREV